MLRSAPLLALLLAAPALAAPVCVTNYSDGETVRHPVPLLKGTLEDKTATRVTVVNRSSDRSTKSLDGVADDGHFKALTELVPGKNELTVRAGKQEEKLTLVYKPQTNPYVVRVVWMTDKSGDKTYQTPFAKDPQNYEDRLDVLMKLLQTFTAERMHDLGYGRVTFNLELDKHGKVKVHTLAGPRQAEYYYKLDDQAWYAEVHRWIEGKLPTAKAKNLVIAAYTRKDERTGKVQGHTALGGGGLGLFGSAGVYAWPASLADVNTCFADDRRVDGKKVHDDSAFRSTNWGVASTTMGATLHEMGHTFGLPHSREPMDIMTRGFDHFHRAFTLVEAPSRLSQRPVHFTDRDVAAFSPISAAWLKGSRFFALDARKFRNVGGPAFAFDESAGELRIESANGLRFVATDRKGDAIAFEDYWDEKKAPKQVRLSGKKLAALYGAHLRVLDDEGLSASADVDRLTGRYGHVRAWRFAPEPIDWTRYDRFVELSEKKLGEIEKAAAARPMTTSSADFVDFTKQYRKTESVTGYAYRVVKVQRRTKVKLLAGSDDALRVWLNGKLVLQALALRAPRPDDDSATVDLEKGDNRLLVEVSQAGAGWGLYLRFEDEKGGRLRLDDKGELRPVVSK